jgi:hypothetical protein
MMQNDNWGRSTGAHYRELAGLLREVAAKSRLANPQQEILKLALAYEHRAEHLEMLWQPRTSKRPELSLCILESAAKSL